MTTGERQRGLEDVDERLLDQIADYATMAADLAVITAQNASQVRTAADATRIAVRAAIRNAVGNGALILVPEAEQPVYWRMSDPSEWEEDGLGPLRET